MGIFGSFFGAIRRLSSQYSHCIISSLIDKEVFTVDIGRLMLMGKSLVPDGNGKVLSVPVSVR